MVDELAWDAPGPGTWRQDRAHVPAPLTPIVQEIYPEGFGRGMAEAWSSWGALIDTIRMRPVNGFPYMQPVSFDMPGDDGPKTPEQLGAEIGRRTAVAAAAFEQRVWRDVVTRWDAELKPAAIAKHLSLAAVDLTELSDADLGKHLHDCIAHAAEMWYQHHRFNGMALVPVGDFLLHAARWTGRPPASMFGVFDGWSPVSSMLSPEVAPAVEALRDDPEARAMLDGPGLPEDRLAALRARVPAVDDYMRHVGFRLATGFDLNGLTVSELPDLALGRLQAALEHDAGASLERAEGMAAEIRADVPDEHRAEFDDLLAEARHVYRLRDERGLYSDTSSIGLLRLALIELGTRLFDRGRIGFKYDTLDLRIAEIDGILQGATNPTADELAARVAVRKASALAGAPALLGDPPMPPPPVDELPPPLARLMSAIGFALDGVLGELPEAIGDDRSIGGVAGAPGIAEGPARVIRVFDDLLDIEQGEIIVARATGESFNSFLHLAVGLVTDHGSFASHAAIMGREIGIPAVVGTVDASRRIKTGDRLRVDGSGGVVTVL
jgi:rifampicin phosphotransferase